MSVARTTIVPAWIHQGRDDWVDLGAEDVTGATPPYLGVWIDPQEGRCWHLFSDYPEAHHVRFGWLRKGLS